MADEPKPEARARIKIDEQLVDAGWHIADRGGVTYEHNAIALVEGLLDGNKEADYLLFVDGKIVGVLEAKRSDINLESAAGGQATNYAHIIPEEYPRWNDEPCVVLLANGEKILLRNPGTGAYNSVSSMPTPKMCLELSGVKSYWGGLSELKDSERRALRASAPLREKKPRPRTSHRPPYRTNSPTSE